MLRIAPVANEQTENPIGSVRASRWKPFAKSKPLLQVTFRPARSMPIIGSGRLPGREDSKSEDIQR